MAWEANKVAIHTISDCQANTATSFDIITLHGLGGSWKTSWTSPDGSCWLVDALAVKFPSSRIISLNCPQLLRNLAKDENDVSDLVSEILYDRETNRRTHRPIIFIGHSLGGTLLKQIFVVTHSDHRKRPDHALIHDSIRAFVYLGTPNRKIRSVDFAALCRALTRATDGSLGGTENDLENAFEAAVRINSRFRELGGEDLPAICFYEGREMMIGLNESTLVSRENAIYLSRPIDYCRLDRQHQHLSRLGDLSDPATRAVVRDLERLMQTITTPDFTTPQPQGPKRPRINILSLDGGGVKGLFSLIVLEAILDAAHRLSPNAADPPKLPYQYFDLIAGTSTGGLLAIMLGRLQMSIPACLSAYRAMSHSIFTRPDAFLPGSLRTLRFAYDMLAGNPWYSAEALRTAICAVVKENLSLRERDSVLAANQTPEDACMLAPEPQGSRVFVCAVREGHPHSAARIRTYLPLLPSLSHYHNPHPHPDPPDPPPPSTTTIWQACLATSAAPLYFPPISIDGTTYFDGALASNNPILHLLNEAAREFPLSAIRVALSIGTGKPRPAPDPVLPVWNVVAWMAGKVTDTEDVDSRIAGDERLQGGYVRLQEDQVGGVGEVDLADAGKLRVVEELAREWVQSERGRELVKRAAGLLVGP